MHVDMNPGVICHASQAQTARPTLKPVTSDITNYTSSQSCQSCCDDATKRRIQVAMEGLQTISLRHIQTPPSETNGSCPPYSCTITLSELFYLKREQADPNTPPLPGTWTRVQAELRGTILLIHESPSSSSLRRRPFYLLNRALNKDSPPPYSPTRAYTLQSGKAGIAPDYMNKAFVIRVRAEKEQFLLATDSRNVLLEWVEGLNQGIDISAPLESRPMPGYRSLRKLSQCDVWDDNISEESSEEQ